MTLKFEIFGLENIEMGHLCIKDLVSHSLQIVFGLTEIGARWPMDEKQMPRNYLMMMDNRPEIKIKMHPSEQV